MALQLLFQTHPKGKLLLTGEYSVLDGALALALPTVFGQIFEAYVTDKYEGELVWSAFGDDKNSWLNVTFRQSDLKIIATTDHEKAAMLQKLLQSARALQPHFLQTAHNIVVHSLLDFPKDWGLGTSSTLVAAVAHWAGISPYLLLRDTFGGSGYDLACAYAGAPVLFQIKDEAESPIVKWTAFHPHFRHQLYFVYLGKKQNSREGIAQYKNQRFDKAELAHHITAITKEVLVAPTLQVFCNCLQRHEQLIGNALSIAPVQARLFSDFKGVVKSLGAWGGDFVLACSDREEHHVKSYFTKKGYETTLNYDQMVLYSSGK